MDADDLTALTAALSRVLGPLPVAVLYEVAGRARIVSLASGEVLYRKGDESDGIHIVLSGRLQIDVGEGRVRHLERGDCIGEVAALTAGRRTATVVAVRSVVVAHLTREVIGELMRAHPEAGLHVARLAIERLASSEAAPMRVQEIRTIALVPLDGAATVAELGRRLEPALLQFGSVARLDHRTVSHRLGAIPGTARGPALRRLLDDVEGSRRFVLYQADEELSDWTLECIGQADRVLLVARADSAPDLRPIERALEARPAGSHRAETDLVLLHPGRRAPLGTSAWLAPRTVARHFHVAWEGRRGVGRLARFLAGRAVTLVLGGGGARGFAQIGAVRAIREAGIPIDAAGGTSIGAVVAATVALDWQDERILQSIKRAFVDERPLNDFTVPVFALLAGEKASRTLRRWFGDGDIVDMWVPYLCVTANLTRSCRTVHRAGTLWKALRGSVSLPGILPPFLANGEMHVDGGVLDNLPVAVMAEAIGGRTIAVDTSVRREITVDREKFPSPFEHFASRVVPGMRASGVPTIGSLLTESTTLGGSSAVSASRSKADLYLNPPTEAFDFLDWGRIFELVELGHRYTREKLPAWIEANRQLVQRDEQLEFRGETAGSG